MSSFRIVAASAVLLLAAPSFAEEATPAAPAQGQPPAVQQTPSATTTPPATENPDEVICKKFPAPTGTLLGKRRECHTKREWDQLAAQQPQLPVELQKATEQVPTGQ